MKAGFGPDDVFDSRVGRRPSPKRGRPLLAPCAAGAGAAVRALCARVCLVVVVDVDVWALRRPGAFFGGGSLVRAAAGSVADFVEPVEAEDAGLEAAIVFFVSTRVDNGREVRVALAA